MSIFSIFRKPKPEEAVRSIVEKFVLASLLYAKELEHSDNQQSLKAGAEVAHLFLHLLDRAILARFGMSRRDVLFDSIAQEVIATYIKAVLRPETPPELLFEAAKKMQDTLNLRQITYSNCSSLLGEPFPGIGSMAFAFSFFVRRAIGEYCLLCVDDILAGKKKVSESDPSGLPSAETAYRNAVWIGSMLKTMKFQDDVKCLK